MSLKSKFWVRKWHRRIGVVASVFVLVLAATGLILLFAAPLGLDRARWGGPLIAKAYHLSPQTAPVGVELASGRWVVMVDGLVYVGAAAPVYLDPPLTGAAQDAEFIYVKNGQETLVLLAGGQLVERMAGAHLPTTSPSPLPGPVRERVLQRYAGRGLPASRVLLDIHTGRFFGPAGVWLMALSSLFLLLLSLSGLVLWMRKAKLARR
jgi:uncharacterized iron-regulated membrane protein